MNPQSWNDFHKWVIQNADNESFDMNELLYYLRGSGGDIGGLTATKCTALHFAAIADGSAVLRVLLRYVPHLVNQANIKGHTPLHWACLSNNPNNLSILLRHHGDPNIVDNFGNSLLHFTAEAGKATSMRLLLEKNICNINESNIDGHSPLQMACDCQSDPRCISLLVRNGAEAGKLISYYISKDDYRAVSLLVRHVPEKECLDSEGRTPLHLAALHNHLNLARILLKQGFTKWLSTQDNNGNTPAMLLSTNSKPKLVALLRPTKVISGN